MKLQRPLLALFIVTIIVSFVSCSSKNEDKERNAQEFEDAESSMREQMEEFKIPPPSEIPYLLQATGAEFNQSLVNSREKVDQYTAQNDKAALNLGIYAADLGYLTSYDQTQQAIDYLAACKTLSDDLGLIGTFDAELLEKFEKNISQKDSLTRLLDETMKESQRYLRDASRQELSSLVMAGSFIEGLYIATGLIKTYPKDILPEDKRNLVLTPLMRIVVDQKKSVSELVKMLDKAEQTDMVSGIKHDLKELEETYQKLNIDEQIRNNRADLVLTDKNLEGITNMVEKIRQKVTG